jgi:CheY-like chemotaxis protein
VEPQRSVLVIDDDPEMRSLLVLILEQEGYRLQSAADGREGLELLRTTRPDLIILDMRMPVMDGSEFARRYRAEHSDPAPIVVMTAAEDPRKRAEEIGAAAWLGKPVDLSELFRVVKDNAQLS